MTRIALLSLVAVTGFATNANANGFAQIVHLSPDAPNVDVWINGNGPQLTDVPYLAATPHYRVQPGVFDLDITVTGDTVPVISAQLEVMNRMAYTVVAWDSVANLQPAILVNDLENLDAGNIRLQVTHTAVGVGTVDLWELDGGTKLIDDFDFGASGRLDVPAGPLELGLDLNNDANPDVTFSVPDLGVNTLVNVFAVNDTTGVALYAVYFDGTTARVDAN
jgi:hypothetical protein